MIQKIDIPVRIKAEKKSVLDALKKDKKRKGDRIYFVLLNEIGNAFVDQIPITDLEAVIHSWMDTS